MKDLSLKTRAFLIASYTGGVLVLAWHIARLPLDQPWLLLALCVAGSLASIFKVEGATNRSHYTINFLVYGFTFALLGISAALTVIAVSSVVEWLWRRPPWFIHAFNTACYVLVMYAGGAVFSLIDPSGEMQSANAILAIAAATTTFTLLNHLMVGIIVWLARGEDFHKSGVFDVLPLTIDLTLMSLGASLVILWDQNPFSLVLFSLPLYLIYSTLRVPALERQTETDSKTGLFNHGYFMQQVESELKRASRFDRPMTIVMADLDLLRNINNTYGHLAGDEVLIKIASILKESVREYDVVARFGGEEFAILMPETDSHKAFERAEKIRQNIERTAFVISTSVTPIKVTISIGIAGRERFDQPAQEIIHNADTALYHSKLKGRNQSYICANQAYESFMLHPEAAHGHVVPVDAGKPAPEAGHPEAESYRAASAVLVPVERIETEAEDDGCEEAQQEGKGSPTLVNVYIGAVLAAALLLFGLVTWITPIELGGYSVVEWLALGALAAFVVLTEWFSIELYVKHTTVSTSAVPILAGTLLFGALGAILLSATFAVTAFIKYRSPFNRLLFNLGNQLIAAMAYTGLIVVAHRSLGYGTALDESVLFQLLACLGAAFIVYMVTTALVAAGVSIDLGQPMLQVWQEQYGWLATSYIGMGFIAFSLVFGYRYDHLLGMVLMVVPIVLLRMSQKEYVDRTRTMVNELHEKQRSLEKTSEEIRALNDGLLDTLAEVIDLGDPFVLGHSMRVAEFATRIAQHMGLHKKQVELIRSASMLHDIGKLGISAELLGKPAKLTMEEYEEVKKHVELGVELLEKSPSLLPLVPIIGSHHEHYDGNGYPNGLKGKRIPLEGRIVAACDAIETMNSDRPYRKRLPAAKIVEELQRCSGTQFDPLVVQTAVAVFAEMQQEAAAQAREAATNLQPATAIEM
jgi:diguanylate cyclase (GGDEF)-like protein/putative nucleotidyltransferase with HDIG domain